MNIEDLTKLLSALSPLLDKKNSNTQPQKTEENLASVFDQFKGKYVLVRHHMMGVNVGYLSSYDDKHFVLSESRKLWRWQAKNSIALESVAMEGIKEGTRATHTVDEVVIPYEKLCGIMTVKDSVIKTIKLYPVTEQD